MDSAVSYRVPQFHGLLAVWGVSADGVFGGEIFIKSSYNGRDLYHNQWDLCTVEEDMDDQVIECPLKPGAHNFVKDIKIPNYLPKVRTTG